MTVWPFFVLRVSNTEAVTTVQGIDDLEEEPPPFDIQRSSLGHEDKKHELQNLETTK